jgi:hypothetical protein
VPTHLPVMQCLELIGLLKNNCKTSGKDNQFYGKMKGAESAFNNFYNELETTAYTKQKASQRVQQEGIRLKKQLRNFERNLLFFCFQNKSALSYRY